ncbi:MAG: hypothetical protein C4519_17540 [Desulfobacteraceae bacterium]|nr:MAG: hypothetical protein C4519_17540 [Desulfobacteraceae bacterium]
MKKAVMNLIQSESLRFRIESLPALTMDIYLIFLYQHAVERVCPWGDWRVKIAQNPTLTKMFRAHASSIPHGLAVKTSLEG